MNASSTATLLAANGPVQSLVHICSDQFLFHAVLWHVFFCLSVTSKSAHTCLLATTSSACVASLFITQEIVLRIAANNHQQKMQVLRDVINFPQLWQGVPRRFRVGGKIGIMVITGCST